MSIRTTEVTVTEFLRPEGSHEPAVYSVPYWLEVVTAILHAKSVEVCCDIYPDGMCRVYIYDPIDEIAIATSPKRSHSVAQDLLKEILIRFDFKSLV